MTNVPGEGVELSLVFKGSSVFGYSITAYFSLSCVSSKEVLGVSNQKRLGQFLETFLALSSILALRTMMGCLIALKVVSLLIDLAGAKIPTVFLCL